MAVSDSSEVCAITTGSFQNQPTQVPTPEVRNTLRKRRLDPANILEPAKRTSRERAATTVASILAKGERRGNPAAAGLASGRARRVEQENNKPGKSPARSDSLCQIIRHNPRVYTAGMKSIEEYIGRNATFDMQKAFAIQVFCTAVSTWGQGVIDACNSASAVTGYSAWTIRKWVSSYFLTIGSTPEPIDNLDDELIKLELSSDRGSAPGNQSMIIHDEEFQRKARQFVRSNSYRKGQPNMTSNMFKEWISRGYGVTVCEDTARMWLHRLGFSQKNHQKGVFFDGHDRDDVVQDRTQFLDTLAQYDEMTISPYIPTPVLPSGSKALIRVVHDESTFYANADQTHFWADGHMLVLRQKSLGQAIMVSDFIVEGEGYLRDENGEARVLLETSSEGYFNNEKFLDQVDVALDIFDRKYPQYRGIFMFDNAPCHKKVPDDALKVEHMNVNPGGKQPAMRDTTWNGNVQKMVLADGRPKGLKLVLEERGVSTTGMNADKLRERLKQFQDFTCPRTLVEDKVESRGHICLFPKFHCELNAIERNWCHAKKHTRAYCNGSIVRLRQLVPEALETVHRDMMNKFFGTCRDYERAYREGNTGSNVEVVVKAYKSHRRVFNT